MIIKFVNYDKKYCELSWIWLNDDEIKKLTMTPNFSKESQDKWFNSLEKRTDYLVWGVECDGIPIGVVGLKNIDYSRMMAEYFGYIGEKDHWHKGIGKIMMQYVIEKAMKSNLNKIYLKVANYNERAINLYIKNGFQVSGDDGECLNMIRQGDE